MRKVKLYIAASLDGKIARANGDTTWLETFPNPDITDHGYAAFYDSVDTILMGFKTYKIINDMDISFPYVGKENVVFTLDKTQKDTEHVKFVSENMISFIKDLKMQDGKDIWLVGGGMMNTLFLNDNLLDEIRVFTMPIVLGDGIPLFSAGVKTKYLKLIEHQAYSTGAVELVYEVGEKSD